MANFYKVAAGQDAGYMLWLTVAKKLWFRHSADGVSAPQEQQLTDIYHMLDVPPK